MYPTPSALRAPLLVASVLALAGCGKPAPTVITDAPSAAPQVIDERGVSELSVEAATDEGRDPRYLWVQLSPPFPAGTFSSPQERTTLWVAPAVDQTTTFTLRVTITDGETRPVEAEVRVAVVDVPTVNRPPVVAESISAPASAIAGDAIPLSISASDPDGDPLLVSWTQVSPATPGVFTGAGTLAPSWRSPDLASSTAFQFQVSISDGENPAILRTATVQLEVPTYVAHIQPLFDAACTGCHGGATPKGTLDLSPSASYAQLVDVLSVCGAIDRVEPFDPTLSSLVQKLEGTSCGDRMPLIDLAYFDRLPGQLTRLRSWILAGALP